MRCPLTMNRARVGPQQAENQLEDDRLSGAARAEQDRHAGLRHAETDFFEDDVIVEGEGHLVEDNRQRLVIVGGHQLAY